MRMLLKINNKSGFSIVITPIIVLFCTIFLLLFSYFIVNIIKPFIWYEKLNNISNKYMFVIEKYGYLTQNEKLKLEKDIEESGFDIAKIDIIYPQSQKPSGQLLEFSIKYKVKIYIPFIHDTKFEKNTKEIDLIVKKHSFSKV